MTRKWLEKDVNVKALTGIRLKKMTILQLKLIIYINLVSIGEIYRPKASPGNIDLRLDLEI